MSRAALLVLGLLLPAHARAGEVTLTVLAGKDFPFYDQTFVYDPGRVDVGLREVTVEPLQPFRLDAAGGLALSAALAAYVNDHLGVEARMDTADVTVDSVGARYRVRARIAAGLPVLETTADLGRGVVDLKRLRPLSLNLKLRTGGATSLGVSGGVSWLPEFTFALEQGLAVGGAVPVGTAGLRAAARPAGRDEGRLGANLGGEVARRVSPRVTLLAEFRYFAFQKQTLEWGDVETTGVLPLLEGALVDAIVGGLGPVRFNPTFFQAAVGVSVRF